MEAGSAIYRLLSRIATPLCPSVSGSDSGHGSATKEKLEALLVEHGHFGEGAIVDLDTVKAMLPKLDSANEDSYIAAAEALGIVEKRGKGSKANVGRKPKTDKYERVQALLDDAKERGEKLTQAQAYETVGVSPAGFREAKKSPELNIKKGDSSKPSITGKSTGPEQSSLSRTV